jgi:hypothetical protein
VLDPSSRLCAATNAVAQSLFLVMTSQGDARLQAEPISRMCVETAAKRAFVDVVGEDDGREPNCALVRIELWCALRRHSRFERNLRLKRNESDYVAPS